MALLRPVFGQLRAAMAPAAPSARRFRDACRIHLQAELPMGSDPRQIIGAFREAVNMSPEEVEGWLAGDESRAAVEGAGEAADRDGRHAARRIVEMLRKDDSLYYEADYEHMHQITQYIRCHRDQLGGPGGAAGLDPLTAAHLKNFGFDPYKAAPTGSLGAGAAAAEQPPAAGDAAASYDQAVRTGTPG